MKTPLNSIVMASDELSQYTVQNPAAEKLRNILSSSGKLLFSLVNDLLDLY
jgi:signal transduction histidine kinase